MADSPDSSKEPNLELPSFGLRRRRKKERAETEPALETESPAESPAESPVEETRPVGPPPEPESEPAPEPASEPGPNREPTLQEADRSPAKPARRGFWHRRKDRKAPAAPAPVADAAAATPAVEQTRPIQVTQPEPRLDPQPVDQPDSVPPEHTEPESVEPESVEPESVEPESVEPESPDSQYTDPDPEAPAQPKRRHLPRLPPLPQGLAAFIAGILTGLVGVVLGYVTINGCEAVRGVGSCGGVGLVALLVVLAAEVVFGAILLKALSVIEPTSTAFLGVGVVAVLAMLFFLSSIDSVWMFVVIPALTAVAFVLSTWLTRSFVDTESPS